MPNLIVVGGSPSSGTTLLADLLDATPGMACPPELYVWCYQSTYKWDKAALVESAVKGAQMNTRASYAAEQVFFNRKYRDLLGLDDRRLKALIEDSDSAAEFYTTFGKKLARERWRATHVFCEKTPMNVNWSSEFCTFVPDGLFVHVLRSGYDVVNSLMKRGYQISEAALIWMYQFCEGMRARGNPNYLEIRYEDLLQRPFEIAVEIASKCGLDVYEGKIERRFRNNTFRSQLPRPRSWSASTYTGNITLPVVPQFDDDQLAFLNSATLWRTTQLGPVVVAHFGHLMNEGGYSLKEVGKPDPAFVDAAREAYIRRSKNFQYQNTFIVTHGDDPAQVLVKGRAVAFQEIERLRHKLTKMSETDA